MTDKSIGPHTWGPEDRVVAARLGERFWYSSYMPAPCAGQYVQIVAGTAALARPYLAAYGDTTAWGYYVKSFSGGTYYDDGKRHVGWSRMEFYVGGTVVSAVDGTIEYRTYFEDGVWVYEDAKVRYCEHYSRGTTDGGQRIVGDTSEYFQYIYTKLIDLPEYKDMLEAARNAATAHNNQLTSTVRTRVVLDDGRELAQAPYYVDIDNGLYTDYVYCRVWDGGDGVDLYSQDSSTRQWRFSRRLPFTPPVDALPPAWTIGGTPEYITSFDDGSGLMCKVLPDLPPGTAEAAGVPSYKGYYIPPRRPVTEEVRTRCRALLTLVVDTVYVRERVRRRTCSSAFLAELDSGTITALLPYIRVGHPVSSGTYMPTRMVENYGTETSSTVVSGENNSITTVSWSRPYTLSYTYTNAEGETLTDSQTINQQATRVTVICKDDPQSGGYDTQYTTTTYVNYMTHGLGGATNTTDLPDILHDFRRDVNWGMLQMLSGVIVSGAAHVENTLGAWGTPYTPPLPLSYTDLVASHPAIYSRYRERIPRAYAKGEGSNLWLDSVFADGEVVTVIPVSTKHSTFGNLGVFPHAVDLQDTSKLSMTAVFGYVIRYAYATGTWSFVRRRPLYTNVTQDGVRVEATETSPVQLPYESNRNLVFLSHKAAWPDVRSAYMQQASGLSEEPDNYPLYLALRSSL